VKHAFRRSVTANPLCPYLAVLAAMIGCNASPTAVTEPRVSPEAEAHRSLIADGDREHDFGAVIGRPGQKMDHRYRLANATSRDVAITDVINRKTCRGIVNPVAKTLRPGESTDVVVTLVVGDRFGGIVHEAEVVTGSPDEPSIVLRTSARAFPAFRVEELASNNKEAILIGSQPREAEFRVVATGNAADPAADLDRMTLRSTVSVEWSGPKEVATSDLEGLTAESRRFVARLDPANGPGARKAEVLVLDGDQPRFRHALEWTIETPLSASPRMVVMKPAQAAFRVLIQARDRKPFRVDRVESAYPGVRGRAAGGDAATTQVVEIEGSPPSDVKKGTLTVVTDHPAQPKLDLPFMVLD